MLKTRKISSAFRRTAAEREDDFTDMADLDQESGYDELVFAADEARYFEQVALSFTDVPLPFSEASLMSMIGFREAGKDPAARHSAHIRLVRAAELMMDEAMASSEEHEKCLKRHAEKEVEDESPLIHAVRDTPGVAWGSYHLN